MHKLSCVAICVFLVMASGCNVPVTKEQMCVLQDVTDNQSQISSLLKRQKEGFVRLQEDILHGRLKKGASRDTVVMRYSEPAYCTQSQGGTEACLYRLPTAYFHTDSVQLYFDASENLVSWQYTPAQNK